MDSSAPCSSSAWIPPRRAPGEGAPRAEPAAPGRLTYVTGRGAWYQRSWKGDEARSGGVATNIGIHLFDLLIWLFGPAVSHRVHLREATRMGGSLELERADVAWFLSVDVRDLPISCRAGHAPSGRSSVDGEGSSSPKARSIFILGSMNGHCRAAASASRTRGRRSSLPTDFARRR